MQIDMGRTLNARDQHRALYRYMAWARDMGCDGPHEPNLIELRWSDDFGLLWVSKLSGLIEYGLGKHKALVDNERYAIYDTSNPAAHALLEIVRDVTKSKLEETQK